MPIVAINVITRPEHLVEYLAEYIEDSELGFAHVLKYNEKLIPEYPSILIMAGPVAKEVHGTHTFAVTLRADIYVLHAKMTEDYQTRAYNDMVLATDVVNYLETHPESPGNPLSLGGRVIAGWVEGEIPGVSPPRTNRSDVVISTRITYQAIQETRFK